MLLITLVRGLLSITGTDPMGRRGFVRECRMGSGKRSTWGLHRATAKARIALATLASVVVGTVAAILPATAAAACGQRTTGYPQNWRGGGAPPLVIGDSILYDVVPALAQMGFQADSVVCRQMSQGLAVLQQRRATLPHLVVLELGTNGAVTAQNIEQALAILGPQRLLVMITPHNGVDPADDAIITDFAADHRRRMLVLDWNHVADRHQC
jgi:hypothetical protein